MRKRRVIVGIGLLAIAAACDDDNVTGIEIEPDEFFQIFMIGGSEVPRVETDAAGEAVFRLLDGPALRYQLSVLDIAEVTAAHIHEGEVGENGPILVTLFTADPPETFGGPAVLVTDTITAPDADVDMTMDELLDLMRSGGTYVNVHTVENPGGEIRGQIGVAICEAEFYPCTTAVSWIPGVTWEVTNNNGCGGQYAPTTLTYLDYTQWECSSRNGSFNYLDQVSGTRFLVQSYSPDARIFKDPYLTCAFTDYQSAGAGTTVPPYACAPDYTGDGEWPFSNLNLVDQGDTSHGLAAGQSCDVYPGGSGECPGIGEMQASNEGTIYVLNNGSTGVCVQLAINGNTYGDQECLNDGGDTWVTDIKAGATVQAIDLDNQESGQILITYVQSFGHDAVHALADQ